MLLDINHARIVHLDWEQKLEKLIRGHHAPLKVSTHDHCILGNWLYTQGIGQYRHIPEIMKLEQTHKDFHDLAQKIVDEKHQHNDKQKVQDTLIQLKSHSKDIVYLLSIIELKVLHQQERLKMIKHPMRALKNLFRRS